MLLEIKSFISQIERCGLISIDTFFPCHLTFKRVLGFKISYHGRGGVGKRLKESISYYYNGPIQQKTFDVYDIMLIVTSTSVYCGVGLNSLNASFCPNCCVSRFAPNCW